MRLQKSTAEEQVAPTLYSVVSMTVPTGAFHAVTARVLPVWEQVVSVPEQPNQYRSAEQSPLTQSMLPEHLIAWLAATSAPELQTLPSSDTKAWSVPQEKPVPEQSPELDFVLMQEPMQPSQAPSSAQSSQRSWAPVWKV